MSGRGVHNQSQHKASESQGESRIDVYSQFMKEALKRGSPTWMTHLAG